MDESLGGNRGVWGGVRIEGRLDVCGVAAALGRGPLVAVRGDNVVCMQVPCGLYAGAAWFLYRYRVIFAQLPRDLCADSAWSLFRCRMVFLGCREVLIQVPRGIYAGAKWFYSGSARSLFRSRVVLVQVLHGCYTGAKWCLCRCRVAFIQVGADPHNAAYSSRPEITDRCTQNN